MLFRIFGWILYHIFWVLLLAPTVAELLKEKEWTSSIHYSLNSIYDFSTKIIGESYFQWVSGFLFGLAIGVLIFNLFLFAKSRYFNYKNRVSRLTYLLVEVKRKASNFRKLSRSTEDESSLDSSVHRLFDELIRLKLEVPDITLASGERCVSKLLDYIGYVLPFSEDADLGALKRASSAWSRKQFQERQSPR